jgi:3-dehydroquinate synthase
MKRVRVPLGSHSYDISFGPVKSGLSSSLRRLGFAGRRALLVTAAPIARAGHSRAVLAALKKAGIRTTVALVPDGEVNKTIGSLTRLYRSGAEAGLDRKSLVVAVGGGVITDMAGFFAATYMRGVSFVSVPTTLLGMVDAAIGGKTGVDTPDGKNLVGAFWQPRLVWIDTGLLRTLSKRDWRTGFAEVAKYGVIANEPFFRWLVAKIQERPSMARWRPADVDVAVRTSAASKARIVVRDERETPLAGGREILNFGHTAGHALEAATGFRRFSHGEAISVGMAVAGELAVALGRWRRVEHTRMLKLLTAAGLPVRFPRLSTSQKKAFWSALRKDKKNVDARLRFVLPRKIGRVEVRSGISVSDVRRAAVRCGF